MKYTTEQLDALAAKPRAELNPSEFLAVFYHTKGKKTLGSTYLDSDADLYEVFKKDPRSLRSANQFKLAVGRAGLSISHKRAADLYPKFKQMEQQDG